MKKTLVMALVLFCTPLFSACSAEQAPNPDASAETDQAQETRGVKQTPLSSGPQLKDRL